MIKEVLADVTERMEKTLDALNTDLRAIRTGRASPSLVERIMVDYYNTPTPLQQLAAISIPEAQVIVIRPYSPSDIGAIEKAITKSDLGLSPSNDGQQVRLTIPQLTEQRRRELTKTVAKRAEEARVSVRNIRRDAMNDLRELQKESMISEDELHRSQEQVQDKTNDYIKRVDEIARDKDQEIMTL